MIFKTNKLNEVTEKMESGNYFIKFGVNINKELMRYQVNWWP